MEYAGSKWQLYDSLIEGIPAGIAVSDFCIGHAWCYVVAESGMGISYYVAGSARETFRDDPRNFQLHEVAALVKSWNFREASLGLAALNAWYSQPDKLEILGAEYDDERTGSADRTNPFTFMYTDFEQKKVTVVGHFPNVDYLSKTAELTVLERNCTSSLDVPDSACEYILPGQDIVVLTGTTLINKTAPRLLELCSQATVVLTGPSTVPSMQLRDAGVDIQAGSVVVDPDSAKFAIKGGSKGLWRSGIKKFVIR